MKKFILRSVLLTISCFGTAIHAEFAKPEANALPNTTANTPAATPGNTPIVDCKYVVPAGTTNVDEAILIQWAEKATKQSFDFKHDMIEKQLIDLKSCFTDSGWQSFNDALQKSGNIAAIKSQKLNVNSAVTGTSTLSKIKDNQWKINMPFEVVYQSEKETIKQSLIVDLMVERKTTGGLGIMQIVVAPQETKTATPSISSTPSASSTPSTTIKDDPANTKKTSTNK